MHTLQQWCKCSFIDTHISFYICQNHQALFLQTKLFTIYSIKLVHILCCLANSNKWFFSAKCFTTFVLLYADIFRCHNLTSFGKMQYCWHITNGTTSKMSVYICCMTNLVFRCRSTNVNLKCSLRNNSCLNRLIVLYTIERRQAIVEDVLEEEKMCIYHVRNVRGIPWRSRKIIIFPFFYTIKISHFCHIKKIYQHTVATTTIIKQNNSSSNIIRKQTSIHQWDPGKICAYVKGLILEAISITILLCL